MRIFSPEAGNIARGRSPRVILPVMSRVKNSSCYPRTRATIVLLYRLVLLFLSVCRKPESTSFHLQSHL